MASDNEARRVGLGPRGNDAGVAVVAKDAGVARHAGVAVVARDDRDAGVAGVGRVLVGTAASPALKRESDLVRLPVNLAALLGVGPIRSPAST